MTKVVIAPPPTPSVIAALALALLVGGCAASAAGGAATSGPGATPSGRPPDGPEAEMLERVNAARAREGGAPLAWDGWLAAVAEAHAVEMAQERYVAHESPITGAFTDRLRRAGYVARASRENVGAAPSVASVMEAFLRSPGHRANLLAEEVTHVGLGVAESPDGVLYVTQLFADPARQVDPDAFLAAFLDEVATARRRRRVPPLTREPLLERAAAAGLAEVRGRVTGDALGRIARGAVLAARGEGRRDLLSLEVMGWRVVDARSVSIPPALLQPGAEALGAAARRVETGEGPRFDLVVLLAR